MSQDWRAGEYCSSELSVDCLRVSYRTWLHGLLDVMIVEGPMDHGCLDSLEPLDPDPEVVLGNPWVPDPESSFSEPRIKLLKGPHSATLGEATLGTCWGIAFYRSVAGHHRVPVLNAAFC
ncbi:hypothetical protein F2Q69_00013529 [Brassica cretica]|uniref:Uncharacterized protein n=1 Tax=Brassica cretica TaxID=69181 RepID=A0A8S9RA05_BRACR|nr:hypothetical protein F2Q69_00013529 [Brassica cretica]